MSSLKNMIFPRRSRSVSSMMMEPDRLQRQSSSRKKFMFWDDFDAFRYGAAITDFPTSRSSMTLRGEKVTTGFSYWIKLRPKADVIDAVPSTAAADTHQDIIFRERNVLIATRKCIWTPSISYAMQTDNYVILATEALPSKSQPLINAVKASDAVSQVLMAELVLALEELHGPTYVAMRVLTLDQCWVNEHGHLSIVDMENAIFVNDTDYGTRDTEHALKLTDSAVEFAAPELFASENNVGISTSFASDFWSLGVIFFKILTAGVSSSLSVTDNEELLSALELPEAQDLISKLLQRDLSNRLTNFEELKSHAFFKDICWNTVRQDATVAAAEKDGVVGTSSGRVCRNSYTQMLPSLYGKVLARASLETDGHVQEDVDRGWDREIPDKSQRLFFQWGYIAPEVAAIENKLKKPVFIAKRQKSVGANSSSSGRRRQSAQTNNSSFSSLKSFLIPESLKRRSSKVRAAVETNNVSSFSSSKLLQ